MKKLFLASLVILALFSTVSFAHAENSCETIDSTTYSECCDPKVGGDAVAANNDQCTEYEKSAATAGTPAASTTATTTACSPVTVNNKYACCETGNAKTPQQQNACLAYYLSAGSSSAVQSPSPATGAVNGGTVTSGTSGGAIVSVNQAAITSCSSIHFNTLLDIAIWAKCIIGAVIIPGIFTLAFAVFLWGVLKFVRSSDQKDKQDSKQFIYMGLIGLFVMVSVWGIIKIASTTLGLDTTVPLLQTQNDPLGADKVSK